MTRGIIDFVETLNAYEKQELVKFLTDEIFNNHNLMDNNLNNIDGHIFGMINNAESNSLNELTMTQLGRIKKLSSKGDR